MHDFLARWGLDATATTLGGFCGAFMSFAFGEVKGLLLWLLIFVLFDFITGIMAGWRSHSFASNKVFQGVLKKSLMFWIVALAHGLDQIFSSLTGSIALFQSITICAYAAGEFISILENLCRAGYEEAVPPVLHRLLTEVNSRFDKAGVEAFLPQGHFFHHDDTRNPQQQSGQPPAQPQPMARPGNPPGRS